MDRQLNVWSAGQHVGILAQDAGRLQFTYRLEWLAREGAFALSHSLPLRSAPFDDRACRPFFAGLLPEGDKREKIAQRLGISAKNDFALLDGIGGECAGAVMLLPAGEHPETLGDAIEPRWLNDRELCEVLVELPRRPMLAGDHGLRLSLAGAQDKLPVLIREGHIGLPKDNSPSSHIIKPEISGFDGTVFNEAFCLALATRLKIPAVKSKVCFASGRPYLLVERYDRRVSKTVADGYLIERLHQEDFCQALGVAPEYKYQSEGGPDLAGCFALVRRVIKPFAPSVLQLMDFVIFNALVGNHDAHGKNFSLIYDQKGVSIAPLYDVLCTIIYPDLSAKMAMKIGGKYRFEDVMPRHWDEFSEQAKLSAAQVKKRVFWMTTAMPDAAKKELQHFVEAGIAGDTLVQIVGALDSSCALMRSRLSAK